MASEEKIRKKNPIGVAFGLLGASKGGVARKKALTSKQRSAIARQGALARAKKLSAKRRSEIARKAGLSQQKAKHKMD